MSYKKYKKFLERLQYQSSSTHSCILYQREGISADEFIEATYSNKCFQVLHNVCGESVKEDYGDWNLEHFMTIDEENTKLLMLRTGSHDGAGLIKGIEKRFASAGYLAKKKIEDFCKAKGITYSEHCY